MKALLETLGSSEQMVLVAPLVAPDQRVELDAEAPRDFQFRYFYPRPTIVDERGNERLTGTKLGTDIVDAESNVSDDAIILKGDVVRFSFRLVAATACRVRVIVQGVRLDSERDAELLERVRAERAKGAS